MNKKVVWGLVAVLAMVVAMGCAPQLQVVQKDVTVAGIKHNYVFAEGTGKYGGWLQTMDRYSQDGTNIIAASYFGNGGLWDSALKGAIGDATIGAGLGFGLWGQGAARVIQGGAKATGGAGGAGGKASVF